MPVIASDAPIVVERAHEGGTPLVLRVNRYGPDYGPNGFGAVSYTHLTLPTTPYV